MKGTASVTEEERNERAELAATPGLPEYTRRVIQHPTTGIEVARKLVALASPSPAAASAAMRETAERAAQLDRECGIAAPATASFDPVSQRQTFGAASAECTRPKARAQAESEAAEDLEGVDESLIQTFGESKGGE